MIPTKDWEFDLQEELERKVLETMGDLDNQFKRAQITPFAYRTALKTLDKALRGLIPETFLIAIENELDFLPENELVRRVWASSSVVYLLAYTCGEDHFVVRTIPASAEKARKVKGEGNDPVRDANDRFNQFQAKLKAAGYKQL